MLKVFVTVCEEGGTKMSKHLETHSRIMTPSQLWLNLIENLGLFFICLFHISSN